MQGRREVERQGKRWEERVGGEVAGRHRRRPPELDEKWGGGREEGGTNGKCRERERERRNEQWQQEGGKERRAGTQINDGRWMEAAVSLNKVTAF